MSKSEHNVPKLRFPGFTDPWEQRKLCEVSRYATSTLAVSDVDPLGQFDLYDANSAIGKVNKHIQREPYITIIKDGAGVGRVRLLPKNTSFIGTLGAISPTEGSIGFLYSLLQSFNFSKYIIGSTIPHIYFSDYGNKQIFIPRNCEQQKIGDLFQTLDDLITLHQRKLENLKLQKKGLLQKMFPKDGEDRPELRFPGFTDPWEQRKLGELAEFRRGLTYKPSNIANEGILVLRSSNINEDTFTLNDDDVFVDPSAINIDFVAPGDILITAANGSSRLVGKHAIIREIPRKTAVHGGFMLLARASNCEFINASMSSPWYRNFINRNVFGGNGAIGNLSKGDFEKQPIYVPRDAEKTKIGNFFHELDNLITLHQRKLEHLQEQKKALLQQMFV